MGESLLEEYLEGAKRFSDETNVAVQGAIFDRALSPDEIEAVMELAVIGADVPARDDGIE